MRSERNAVRASRRDDQAIGRITLERTWKALKGDDDLHVERHDFDDSDSSRVSNPDVEGAVEYESILGMQHLRFPKTDCCQTKLSSRRQSIQCIPLLFREPIGAQQPPEPDMRVQQNPHRDASNSRSPITDSSGSAFSSPDPRRISQALSTVLPATGGLVSRATTLPRRLMSMASPAASTRRMSSRQLDRNSVTEMSMRTSYMGIWQVATRDRAGRMHD